MWKIIKITIWRRACKKYKKNSKICDLCPFCTGREGAIHAKELTSYYKRVNNDDFVWFDK